MTVERWSPFREFLNLQNEMDRAFRRTFGWPAHRAKTWSPSMESFARENDLVVRLEVPGIEVNQVNITIKDNLLTISGERKHTETVHEEDYYAEEFSYGAFERSLTLPREAKPEDVRATYQNGVLEIVVPQAAVAPEAKKVQIEVKK